MKSCGPWSNPFSPFGFSARNFSYRIASGLIPALQAYRSSLSDNLSPKS